VLQCIRVAMKDAVKYLLHPTSLKPTGSCLATIGLCGAGEEGVSQE
jgi:hypothetical protein